MKKYSILIMTFNLLFGLTGYELIQKMETRLKPIDSKTDFTMTLTNKKGKTRSCTLRSISKNDGAMNQFESSIINSKKQLKLFSKKEKTLINKIKEININKITPIEALNLISTLKKKYDL